MRQNAAFITLYLIRKSGVIKNLHRRLVCFILACYLVSTSFSLADTAENQ